MPQLQEVPEVVWARMVKAEEALSERRVQRVRTVRPAPREIRRRWVPEVEAAGRIPIPLVALAEPVVRWVAGEAEVGAARAQVEQVALVAAVRSESTPSSDVYCATR